MYKYTFQKFIIESLQMFPMLLGTFDFLSRKFDGCSS